MCARAHLKGMEMGRTKNACSIARAVTTPQARSNSWCSFSQRLVLPQASRAVLSSRGDRLVKDYMDREFSYVVLRRGLRSQVGLLFWVGGSVLGNAVCGLVAPGLCSAARGAQLDLKPHRP